MSVVRHVPFTTYNHLLVLADSNTLPLHNLNILQTAQDFMLDLELGRHVELCPLFDLEWLILQGRLRTFGAEIDSDRRTTLTLHG